MKVRILPSVKALTDLFLDALRELRCSADSAIPVDMSNGQAIPTDISETDLTPKNKPKTNNKRKSQMREKSKAERPKKTKQKNWRKQKEPPTFSSGIADDPWSMREYFDQNGLLAVQGISDPLSSALPPFIPPDRPIGTMRPRTIPGLDPATDIVEDLPPGGDVSGETGTDVLIDLEALLGLDKSAKGKSRDPDDFNKRSQAVRENIRAYNYSPERQNVDKTNDYEQKIGLSDAETASKTKKPYRRFERAHESSKMEPINEEVIEYGADTVSYPFSTEISQSAQDSQPLGAGVDQGAGSSFTFDIAEHLRDREKHKEEPHQREPVMVGAIAASGRRQDEEDGEERFSTPPPFNLGDSDHEESILSSPEESEDPAEEFIQPPRPYSHAKQRDEDPSASDPVPDFQRLLKEKEREVRSRQGRKSKIQFAESAEDEHRSAGQSVDRSQRFSDHDIGRGGTQDTGNLGEGGEETSKHEKKVSCLEVHPDALRYYRVPFRPAEDDRFVIVEDYCTSDRWMELKMYTKSLMNTRGRRQPHSDNDNRRHKSVYYPSTSSARTFDSGFFGSESERLDRALSHIPATTYTQPPSGHRSNQEAAQARESQQIPSELRHASDLGKGEQRKPSFVRDGPNAPSFIPLPPSAHKENIVGIDETLVSSELVPLPETVANIFPGKHRGGLRAA